MAMTLIETNTHTSAVTESTFTSSIDSTYKLYIFKLLNILPATDGEHLQVNFSTDGGSNYNMTKTTTNFDTTHTEGGADAALTYRTARDLAQATGGAPIANTVGSGSDEGTSGTLWLFNPSNTTYVKHFYSRLQGYGDSSYSRDYFAGGYVNSTSDVYAIQFAFSSGNIAAGVIKMYGVG